MLHDCGEYIGVGVGLHAVSEIEDVARVAAVVCEDGARPLDRCLDASEYQRRVEVALHDEIATHPGTGRCDRCSPVESEDRRRVPVGLGGAVHRLEQVIAADAEVDAGNAWVKFGELSEHLARMGQHELAIVGKAERTGPRVEHLKSPSAMGELCADEGDGMLHEPFHDGVPQSRLAVHHLLGVLVRAARPTLDEVTRHREWRARKGEQRNLGWQFGREHRHRALHIGHVVVGPKLG